MHDTMNENATTPVRLHATYTVATPRWARMSPVDCAPTKKLNGGPIGAVPNMIAPTTSPVTTTMTTATHAEHRDDELGDQEPAPRDRPHEDVAQVAPAR